MKYYQTFARYQVSRISAGEGLSTNLSNLTIQQTTGIEYQQLLRIVLSKTFPTFLPGFLNFRVQDHPKKTMSRVGIWDDQNICLKSFCHWRSNFLDFFQFLPRLQPGSLYNPISTIVKRSIQGVLSSWQARDIHCPQDMSVSTDRQCGLGGAGRGLREVEPGSRHCCRF